MFVSSQTFDFKCDFNLIWMSLFLEPFRLYLASELLNTTSVCIPHCMDITAACLRQFKSCLLYNMSVSFYIQSTRDATTSVNTYNRNHVK